MMDSTGVKCLRTNVFLYSVDFLCITKNKKNQLFLKLDLLLVFFGVCSCLFHDIE